MPIVKRSVPVTRGSESHLIVPQSNTCVSTSAGVTNRIPDVSAMTVPSIGYRKVLEPLHLLCNRAFDGQALHAGRSKESDDPLYAAEHVLNIFRFGNRSTMAEYKNFRIDRNGRPV